MRTIGLSLLTGLIFLAFGTARTLGQATTEPKDPFEQRVSEVTLNDQSIIDGIAALGGSAGLAVSVERELGRTISGAAPRAKTFTATVGPGTVSEILDGLCTLDQTFTWVRNGNMVNVIPRALANEPSYFLNRRIDELTFRDVPGAQEAVFKTAEKLPGPKEQVAIMEVGSHLNFARPWSTTLHNVSVREVFNSVANRLGPTYGWQFAGAQDFRIITFHQILLPTPSRIRQATGEKTNAR